MTTSRAATTVTLLGYVAAVVVAAELIHGRAWDDVGAAVLPLCWLVAASLAVRARPDHPAALLFVLLGAAHLAGYALGLPVALDAGSGWGAWTANAFGLASYAAGFAALGAFLATYPTGVPRTRLERAFVRGVPVVVVLGAFLDAATHERVTLVLEAAGHATMPAPPGLPLLPFAVSVGAVVPLLVLVGAVLLVVRGRRTAGEERRQLSWAIGAGGLLALMIIADPIIATLVSRDVASATFVVVASLVPFVLLGGLVRYRLLDVDLYVTRTLASGAAVVIALASYTVVAELTADSRAATAVVVVLAALTGMPLVRWLSRVADRWFSRGRVRGQELLRALTDSLADVAREDVAARTAQTVAAGLDVAWVRVRSADGSYDVGRPGGDRALVMALGSRATLECGPRHGGWSTAETAEVELLARHAGLALDNAALGRRLAVQVEELRASRLRLVRAELDVRQRLERDLHDGVQQQVVALLSRLGALQVLLTPGAASGLVDAARQQAQRCLAELRAVVDGVHPPALLDRGVVEAVTSRAALLPVPVRVRSALSGRRSVEIEAAAYYLVSEALTNVVKHARAGCAEVCFAEDDDALVVTVSDDGVGLGDRVPEGSGLAGLRDRVEALGGRLDVESGSGGTIVRAVLPEVVGV